MTASLSRLILLAFVASCAHPASKPTSGAAAATNAATPSGISAAAPAERGVLASLASEPLIVLPVQTLRLSVPEWTDRVGDQRAYLGTVDDEIAFAIRERAIKGKWAFPADLARTARRNPGYAPDPYTISLDPLTPVERDPDKIIGEPLAGALRAYAGLFNGRYALVPSEMRIVPDAGGGRATLHLVLVDTRAAKVTWKADISGDVVRAFSPAVAAGIAGRVADLFTTAR